MNRKYRYSYGTSAERLYDKMKIQPPVFESLADAYKHFVRHPEERKLVENPDGWRPFGDPLDDTLDRMEQQQTMLSELFDAKMQGAGKSLEVPDSEALPQDQEDPDDSGGQLDPS